MSNEPISLGNFLNLLLDSEREIWERATLLEQLLNSVEPEFRNRYGKKHARYAATALVLEVAQLSGKKKEIDKFFREVVAAETKGQLQ